MCRIGVFCVELRYIGRVEEYWVRLVFFRKFFWFRVKGVVVEINRMRGFRL